jgi:hypothetical protein
MAYGDHDGLTIGDPDFRRKWTFETLTTSDWYRLRLEAKARGDQRRWQQQLDYLRGYIDQLSSRESAERAELEERVQWIEQLLDDVRSPEYLDRLQGTLGADPAVVPHEATLSHSARHVRPSTSSVAYETA